MMQFRIPDMDCGGCVKKVTQAVQSVDPKAVVNASLATREVSIETTGNEADIIKALEEFGYDVEKMN